MCCRKGSRTAADELAATAREDRRASGETRAVLLAAAGGESPDPMPVRNDAALNLGTTGRNGLRRGERNKAAGRRKGSKGGGCPKCPETEALLALAGLAVWMRMGDDRPRLFGPAQLISVSLIFLVGPMLTRWLTRDVHFRNLGGQTDQNPSAGPFAGVASGFLLGFAFAFGWTPCIGPILAGVLAMAATTDTVSRGVFMLAVYSAGLAIPFLLTALGINQFLGFYQRFRRHLHVVEVGSGVLLLAVGCLIFVNRLTLLSGKLTFLNGFVK